MCLLSIFLELLLKATAVPMECKDEAAVERQKLVDDGEVENEDDQTNISTNVPPTNAPKPVQSPNSPVLSNRVSIFPTFFNGSIK